MLAHVGSTSKASITTSARTRAAPARRLAPVSRCRRATSTGRRAPDGTVIRGPASPCAAAVAVLERRRRPCRDATTTTGAGSPSAWRRSTRTPSRASRGRRSFRTLPNVGVDAPPAHAPFASLWAAGNRPPASPDAAASAARGSSAATSRTLLPDGWMAPWSRRRGGRRAVPGGRARADSRGGAGVTFAATGARGDEARAARAPLTAGVSPHAWAVATSGVRRSPLPSHARRRPSTTTKTAGGSSVPLGSARTIDVSILLRREHALVAVLAQATIADASSAATSAECRELGVKTLRQLASSVLPRRRSSSSNAPPPPTAPARHAGALRRSRLVASTVDSRA